MRQDFQERMKATMMESQIPPEPEPAEGDSTVSTEASFPAFSNPIAGI